MKLKRSIKHIILIIILGIISSSCLETFDFESEVKTFESALVIEATITNELKLQKILLSRTFQLDTTAPSPESNASVKVVDDAQNEYLFHETDFGVYISNSAFSAQPNRNYSLQIQTNDGALYSSKAMQLTQNTNIDNVSVERGFNDDGVEGISILVDSYDPFGNSRYYRFEYEETYKIIAPKYSAYEIVFKEGSFFDYDILLRPEQEKICYNTVKSNTIIITSTINLVEDRLEKFTARFISRENYIMSHRYSILVKQYVQTQEAHAFYNALKNLSESESLLSQTQPGFINGNVFSETNQNEKVLGFFEVSSFDQKRVYFNYADFFPDEDLPPYIVGCNTLIAPPVATQGEPPGHPLFDNIAAGFQYFETNDGSIPGVLFGGPEIIVLPECGDCTVLGNNTPPDFWVD